MLKGSERATISVENNDEQLRALAQRFEQRNAELFNDIVLFSGEEAAALLLALAQEIEQARSAAELRQIFEEAAAIIMPTAAAKILLAPALLPSDADWLAASDDARRAFAAQLQHNVLSAAYVAAFDDEQKLERIGGDLPLLVQSLQPAAFEGDPVEFRLMLGELTKVKAQINVNGNALPVKDGATIYKSMPSSMGVHKYTVTHRVTNPFTAETITGSTDFHYLTTVRTALIRLPQQEVFYIGVDNPLVVAAPGVSPNDIEVSASGCDARIVQGDNRSSYTVQVSTQGEVTLTLTDKKAGITLLKKRVRVRRLPDPQPMLSTAKISSGSLTAAEFQKETGLTTAFEAGSIDTEAKCTINTFSMLHQKSKGAALSSLASGGVLFEGAMLKAVKSAAAGDWFHFIDIKAQCPGDKAPRLLSPMSFQIR